MKVLDLFCCEGGAAQGYINAGYEVTGVDIVARFEKRYPGRFVHGDAIEYVKAHGHEYDLIHASPPCQRYSITNAAGRDYPDLVADTREALKDSGKPWVIENVVGAPLHDPITLCWTMFNQPGSVLDDDGTPLQMFRHRLFETNFPIAPPIWMCPCSRYAGCGRLRRGAARQVGSPACVRKGGYVPSKPVIEQLLGIDWMTLHGLFQSIPPVFSEHVGRQAAEFMQEVTTNEPA